MPKEKTHSVEYFVAGGFAGVVSRCAWSLPTRWHALPIPIPRPWPKCELPHPHVCYAAHASPRSSA